MIVTMNKTKTKKQSRINKKESKIQNFKYFYIQIYVNRNEE